MRLKIEEIPSKNHILFIGKDNHTFVAILKKILRHYHFEFSLSLTLPRQMDAVYAIFILNDEKLARQTIAKFNKKYQQNTIHVIAFFVNNRRGAEKLAAKSNITNSSCLKIINTDDTNDEETISKMLWFALSQSTELFLNLEKTLKKKSVHPKRNAAFALRKKTIGIWLICIFLLIECFFIIPLGASSLLLYQSGKALQESDIKQSKKYLTLARPIFTVTHVSYKVARPVLSFLFLALIPDTVINIEENTLLVLTDGIQGIENSKKLFSLVLKTDKTKEEINETVVRLKLLQQTIHALSKRLALLDQKLNSSLKPILTIQEKIKKATFTTQSIEKLLTHADILLGKYKERTYLLLFENNMELRPGGGFIGSFGIATFADYTLKSLEIKDVYEADGQLKTHIEPPDAIYTYLHQPHWFLRDSNFSPDFSENFEKAEFFLERALGLKGFDGGAAITTTALNTIIGAFGSVYVPDYHEDINSDNFYIKTQIYAEKNFFPGSIQKKSFLSSLTRSLILSLDRVSLTDLAYALKQSLDEKQIVWYVKDEVFKKNTNMINWQGKLIAPQCADVSKRCINDNLFPIDANVGVNKANFFISRLISIKVKIAKDGIINHVVSISYKNDSPGDVFPGGAYKNYFQIYLPKNSIIKEVTKNGTLVATYETRVTNHFTILAFYFEIPPQKTSDIQIAYRIKSIMQKGNNTYQLVIQKQIGSINNDVNLEIQIPRTISIVSKNFPALAKERGLVYNTTLSTDKIFVIELIKE